MSRKKPDREFDSLGSFIRFVGERGLKLDRDSGDTLRGEVYFTDGSYAEIEYSESYVSEAGTGWPADLTIRYFEKEAE